MTPRLADPEAEPPKRSNFLLLWDIVVAPSRAFDRIAARPEWILAYVAAAAAAALAEWLELPAVQHIRSLAHNAGAPQTARTAYLGILEAATLAPLTQILLLGTALTFFAGIRDPKRLASYGTFISLAANCMIIAALGDLLAAIGVHLHNPTSFHDFRSLEAAVPVTFGGLATPGNDDQVFFLSHFGVFDIWYDVVLAFGYARLANIGFTTALIVVFVLDFLFAFIT